MCNAPTLAQQIAQLAQRVSVDGLSPQVREATAQRVTDALGNALGAAHLPVVDQMRAVVSGWGGNPQASVVG